MDMLTLLVIKKWAETELKKAAKPAVGLQTVADTVTLKVTGSVKKGADYERTPTVSIPHKLAMALFLEKSGITREVAAAMLVDAMTEALNLNEKGEEFVEAKLRDVDAAEARVAAMLGQLPKVVVNGKTDVTANVTELNVKNAAAAEAFAKV